MLKYLKLGRQKSALFFYSVLCKGTSKLLGPPACVTILTQMIKYTHRPSRKTQALTKMLIWISEVLILKSNFQKGKVVSVKTLFFVIGLF